MIKYKKPIRRGWQRLSGKEETATFQKVMSLQAELKSALASRRAFRTDQAPDDLKQLEAKILYVAQDILEILNDQKL